MAGSPSAEPTPRKLPGSLTPFVGRQADLDAILHLYQDPAVRLVTILGTGGMGKTRFALELAGRLQGQFKHGAVFVPLAPLSTVDELLPALAAALDTQLPPGGDLQQAILDHLGDQQILLVLDNFEHLLEEAALVRDLLDAGPGVRVLVTSREKLNLTCESLYHLRGLELPPLDGSQKVDGYDSVRLFLQKARQARPGFSLTAENTPAVIDVCRLVDGIPLGILLAAAWVELFSPAEITDQIRRSLDFLARDQRDAPPRHTGMRAAFDASFDRLSEKQKAAFRKLAVFRGGFYLAAAERIAGADLHTLLALVDKSLLWREPASGRYDLHELLRQYAGEKLAASSEREQILAAHADFYQSFVHQREASLVSHAQAKALDEIQAEFDNIRQAWGWLVEQRDFRAVQGMTPGLYAFCDMRSCFYEGEAIFRLARNGLALQAADTPHPTWALVLLSWYDMQSYIERFDDYAVITSQALSCLTQGVASGDPAGTAASLILLGAIARHQGDYKNAILNYERGMLAYPALDDFYWVNLRIGLCYQALQNYPQAIQAFTASLVRGQEMGEQVKTGWALLNIGDTLLLQRNPVEAERYLVQARALFQQVGTLVGVLWANYSLSRSARELGDLPRAREFAESAQQIARQLHSVVWIEKTEDLLQRIDPHFLRMSGAARTQEEEPFSQRELEVLQLLKSEKSGPEIARELCISLNTVRYHTKNIYSKLQVSSRLEAIHRANELGL